MAAESQNIYDDPAFLAGYASRERFGTGWQHAAELPDLMALLPDVTGRRVLDLGCGAGQLAHHLATRGAAEVVGVDVSARMLALARATWAHPRVTHHRAAAETVAFPPARFDLVVSSLALHYVEDYRGLVARIAGWLAPDGILVYSVEHPLFTARLPDGGWVVDGEGRRVRWGIDRYADEGPREETWFVPGVRKVHRTFATLLNGLLDAGLTVERVVEPVPMTPGCGATPTRSTSAAGRCSCWFARASADPGPVLVTARTDRLLLVTAMLGQFITGFAARSFVVGLPTIAAALDADIVGMSWALIAYQLAGISLAVVFGRLGDLRGRYVIYGTGFGVMAGSAFLCGIAPSVVWLVIFRLVEGIGAAMIASATRVLAMEALPEGAAGRANGFMTMSFHGGVLLGPPAGGFVIDALSWRWIFFLLVPIGLTGLVLTAVRGAREDRRAPAARGVTVDYAGAALLVLLTVFLTVLLDRRSADLLGLGGKGVMAGLFGVALLGFLAHERRVEHPVVNLALFRIRMFSFSVVSLLVVATSTAVLMLLLPFYMQNVLRQSASFMGLVFLSAPIFTITLAPVVGWITDRIGARVPASIGVLMTTAAFVVGTRLAVDSHWVWPAVLLALIGLGQGFFNTANQTALIASVPRDYRGFATGMVQTLFGLGNLLGTSLGGVLLTVMFRLATGVPDAAPSAADPRAFVLAINATCAVCLGLTLVALTTSLMRGGARLPTAAR